MTDTNPFAEFAVPESDAPVANQDADPFAAYAVPEPANGADPTTAPQKPIDFSRSKPPVEFAMDAPVEQFGPPDEHQQQADDFVAGVFRRAHRGDPAHELEASDISEATGVDRALVATQLDRFRANAKLAQENPTKWRQQNPDLFELMLMVPNMGPTVVKEQTVFKQVAKPDYDKWASEHPWLAELGAIAAGAPNQTIKTKQEVEMQDLSHLNPVYVAGEAFNRAAEGNADSKREYYRMWAEFKDRDSDVSKAMRDARIDRRINQGLEPYYGDGFVNRATATIANAVGSQIDSLGALILGAAVGAGLRKPELGMRVAALASAATSFVTEGGSFYGDTENVRDDKGNPIDQNIRFATANAYAALASGIEVLTLGAQGAGISALNAKRWARSMLTDGTKRGALLDLAKTLGKNAASEGVEESAQQALQLTLQWIAKNISARELQQFDLVAAEGEVAAAGAQGIVSGLVGVGGVSTVSNTAVVFQNLRQSARDGATLAGLHEVAKTKAAQAAPRQVATWIMAQPQEDGRRITHVYVDPTKLVEFAKQGNVSVEDVATQLMGPEGPRRLQDALDVAGNAPGTRATLAVPMPEFLEKWGAKPITEQLAEDLAIGPGRLTLREQRLFQKAVDAQKAEADALADVALPKDEQANPAESAATGSIQQQAEKAGATKNVAKQTTTVLHAALQVLAKQQNRPVEELLGEIGVSGDGVQQPQAPVVRTTSAPKKQTFRDANQAFTHLEGDFTEDAHSFDAVNEQLELTGDKKVTTTKDAFAAIYNRTKGSSVDKASAAVDLLKTIPGLEGMRLPDEVIAQQAAERQQQELDAQRAQADATSFEFGANVPGSVETLKQPSVQRTQLDAEHAALGNDEAKARAYLTDHNTGLLSERGLEDAPRDPTRTHLAEFDVPSKFLNKVDQETLDGVYRAMAGALRQSGIKDGAKVGGSIRAWVKDRSQAHEIQHAMRQAIGDDRFKVTYGVVPVTAGMDAKKTNDALATEHKAVKARLKEQGKIGPRKGIPPAFARPGDPTIAWDGEKNGISPNSPEARAVVDRAVAESADFAQRMREFPTGAENAELSPAHHERYQRDLKENPEAVFDRTYYDDAGLLNDRGRKAIMRANEKTGAKPFFITADVDYFKEMNGAFGEKQVDAINWLFGKALLNAAKRRGIAVDLWHPHGDEYGGQGASEEDLKNIFDDAKKEVANYVFIGQNPETGDISILEGLSFEHATDKNPNQAEGRLDTLKSGAKYAAEQGTAKRAGNPPERIGPANPENRRRALDRAAQLENEGREVFELPGITREWNAAKTRTTPRGASGPSQADQVANRAVESSSAVAAPGASKTRLDQEGATHDRGMIDIIRDGAKRQFKIFLTKHADASTFLHESAHAIFEMREDLAKQPGVSERVKADWETARKWAGAKEGEALTEKQKENLARAFEAYLMEGRAPSSKLAEAFASFRQWLIDIYKDIRALNVELDDDIRGVFDRMLATDQEIERARAAAGLSKPVFTTPQQAGVDPKDFGSYLQAQERVRSEVIARTQRMIYEGQLRAKKAYQTEQFKKLKEKYADEYDQLPQVKAWQYLKRGDIRFSDGTIERDASRGKLDRGAVMDFVGEKPALGAPGRAEWALRWQMVRRLGNRLVKNGENPIDVSEQFGFASANDMLQSLASLPEKDAWVQSEAERAMKDAHPEIEGEIANLQESIQKLLHADSYDQAERDHQIIRVLTKDKLTIEALKASAKAKVENQAVGRLDPGVVLNRERAAATQMAQAMANNQLDLALVASQKRLLHKYMWQALVEARDMRDKFTDLVSDLLSDKQRAKLGKAGAEYRDVVDTLLEALGTTEVRESDEQRAGMDRLLGRMAFDGNGVAFDPQFIGELMGKPKNWQQLKVSELRSVLDALQNIKAAARNKTNPLVNGQRRNHEEDIAELIDSANSLKKTHEGLSTRNAGSFAEDVLLAGQGVDALLLRPETMIEWLGEPWVRIFLKPLMDAKHNKSDWIARTVKPISATFDKIPSATRGKWRDRIDGRALFPDHRKDVPVPTRRYELINLAANMGNESNQQRVLEGRGITYAQAIKAISLLTKEELDLVQSIWDQNDSLWPQIRDLEERDVGLAPDKIKPTPLSIKTSDGHVVELRGGYVPAAYDTRGDSGVGQRKALESIADAMGAPTARPGTKHSHTKQRSENFSDAISLEPQVLQTHIIGAVHDLAYREAVRNAANILLNPDIQATLRAKLGQERADALEPWLRDVGNGSVGALNVKLSGPEKWMRYFRSKVPVAVLGHNLRNYLGDLSGAFTVAIGNGLKPHHYAMGLLQYWRNPKASRDFVLAKSGELRLRSTGETTIQKFTRDMAALEKRRIMQYHDVVAGHAFYFAEQLEKAIVSPAWYGAYHQAIAEGRDEGGAIDFADGVIRKAFPAKDIVDKSAIQRDRGVLGFLSMMIGFVNQIYNQERRIWHPAFQKEGLPDTALAASMATMKHLALAVACVGAEFLVGKGREPDETYDHWLMRKMIAFHLMQVPVAGDVVGGAVEKAMGGHPSTRANPGFAAFEQLAKAYTAVAKSADSGEDWMKAIVAVMTAYGYAFGQPTVFPSKAAEYLLEGDYSNPGGVVGGILYGNRPKKSQDPFQAVDEALNP